MDPRLSKIEGHPDIGWRQIFDLDDFASQLKQMGKMGGLGGIMGMLPGIAKMKDKIASANLDDRIIKRQRAIILSMTPKERRNPDLLKASRKKRIASGSGTRVEDVNKLLKQHRQMADMMKQMTGKRGAMGRMASMLGMGGMPGGMPSGMPMPSPDEIAALQREMGQGEKAPAAPGQAPALPAGLFGKAPGGLPGLGGLKLPGLGGGKLPGLGGGALGKPGKKK